MVITSVLHTEGLRFEPGWGQRKLIEIEKNSLLLCLLVTKLLDAPFPQHVLI